ncbi:hypothetical protein RVF83_12555 [Gordonia rubripertincta]|uniref:Transmembrane protein n=2 Tax=Gordonia rubripertincta TaxID=36822 RepID=A0AAW6R7T4_GORRU|nr:gephyrin-like molybdotransferase receptor GlpR [Gordonia rubripertincta]MDG6780455.1 hypothetical protein [Gordonia rubripertincta]NKY64158.1 hypothetical protein [Gordonia rubripertincta]GAB83394.1 hypothetical protein GORBP_006_00330 [Gordonia rubripertincta NBRC 101908]
MPNSVLWVCLVAVWLFVLVPMVIKGRPQILKSTEAAKKTRLLHRGGSRATAPSTARRRSSARHPHDPSWKSSRKATATAVVDEVEDDTETETEDADVTTKVQRVADVEAEKPTVEATDDTDTEDTDAEDTDLEDVADETDDVEDDQAAETDDDLVDEAADAMAEDTEAEEFEDSEYEDSEEAEYEDDSEAAEYEADTEYEDAADDLDEDEYDDYARASRPTEAEPESVVDELEDEQPVARKPQSERVRRSVYSSEKERELKYRERQRVTLGLFVLFVLSLVSGFLIGTPGWVATGVVGLMLVGYLAYLRRAVKVEQQIRAQRLARAKRAQRAEEERRRRAAAVPEFAAAPPPPRLRRPGGAVVLEIDDEDPVFDHLPPFQRRRMDREDLEYRRVG